MRFGDILGQITIAKELSIWYGNLDMKELSAALQNNRCIQKLQLRGIGCRDTKKMSSLATFLGHNPSLKRLPSEVATSGNLYIAIWRTLG